MKYVLIVPAIITLVALVVVFFGQKVQEDDIQEAKFNLVQESKQASNVDSVYLQDLANLPDPVQDYLAYALNGQSKGIQVAAFQQDGQLRTDLKTNSWIPFKAQHIAIANTPGFIWDARVQMPFGLHVNVVDSFANNEGEAEINLMSAIPFGGDSNSKELTSGALHRYLAEAVWYPTALVPNPEASYQLSWQAMDERSALATLSVNDVTVSLEFHFNEQHQVERIYTPERFAKTETGYMLRPWEGSFSDYQEVEGLRVPSKGQVGWYMSDMYLPVWKGEITDFEYRFN
ncbi:hypothetical protein HF888_10995 [Bermanella marisrubri]|uniref:Uncharacterized protein n=1 Tax=Bermanella marisrubri TaxID=207949 RepID=Q1N5I1_9GAMM|nr:DUF6544 family protein [Bermanella marisrubri]EAT13961.1 hypothetical protein RED65_11224 [Oceanobacter sp. RED65] [Bermanella marisrubri]QIZ84711.1 hypothetical protein HF888_10995 [Bermanella marisrubri]